MSSSSQVAAFNSILNTLRTIKLYDIPPELKGLNLVCEALAFYVQAVFTYTPSKGLETIGELNSVLLANQSNSKIGSRVLFRRIYDVYKKTLVDAFKGKALDDEQYQTLMGILNATCEENKTRDLAKLPVVQRELFVPEWYLDLCKPSTHQ